MLTEDTKIPAASAYWMYVTLNIDSQNSDVLEFTNQNYACEGSYRGGEARESNTLNWLSASELLFFISLHQ